MKVRKQHTPPTWQSDATDAFQYFLRGAFGGASLGELFPGIYEAPCDDDLVYPIEEETTYVPELEEAIVRYAAIGLGQLALPKPNALITHWGQGFLRQNIDRFVRDCWDEHGALPKGEHQVGACRIDFGQGD